MTDTRLPDLAQRVDFHHGRRTTARPFGNDGLLFVLYSGDGPLPDYDITGWINDGPIGGGEVIRVKISGDYAEYGDAWSQLDREIAKKSVARDRGVITLIEDQETKRWALWLETWTDYFSRSHILKSAESVQAQVVAMKSESDAAFAVIVEQHRHERAAYLAKPSTKIFLAVVGLVLLWQLLRLFL